MSLLSFTLVQRIESYSGEIANQVADEIRQDPCLPRLQTLDNRELSSEAQDLLGNLGQWLAASDAEIARWSETRGRMRFERSIPLHELLRCLLLVKEKLIDFARKNMGSTALQVYAEEDLEYRAGRFFDQVVWCAARGYESARADGTPGRQWTSGTVRGA